MKPTSTITFQINGQDINLVFNIASLNSMSTVLFGNQTKAFDLTALLDEINRINSENFMFACKVIIYSGIVGYYLESDEAKPMLSFKEVGKIVGQMTEPELIEYTGKVWESFLNDLGMNLEAIKEVESNTDVKKK